MKKVRIVYGVCVCACGNVCIFIMYTYNSQRSSCRNTPRGRIPKPPSRHKPVWVPFMRVFDVVFETFSGACTHINTYGIRQTIYCTDFLNHYGILDFMCLVNQSEMSLAMTPTVYSLKP